MNVSHSRRTFTRCYTVTGVEIFIVRHDLREHKRRKILDSVIKGYIAEEHLMLPCGRVYIVKLSVNIKRVTL